MIVIAVFIIIIIDNAVYFVLFFLIWLKRGIGMGKGCVGFGKRKFVRMSQLFTQPASSLAKGVRGFI